MSTKKSIEEKSPSLKKEQEKDEEHRFFWIAGILIFMGFWYVFAYR